LRSEMYLKGVCAYTNIAYLKNKNLWI